LSGRRSRVNNEFSPGAVLSAIPRETKFYDSLAGSARFVRAVSEIAQGGLHNQKETNTWLPSELSRKTAQATQDNSKP
jgi:hypothetical protein